MSKSFPTYQFGKRFQDGALRVWINLALAATIFSVLSIVLFVAFESLPFWQKAYDLSNLVGTQWFPREELFGFLPLILGTLAVVFLGLLVSVPFATASAIGSVFYLTKKQKLIFQLWLETAAGFPAVVIGLFGLLTVVPWLDQFYSPALGLVASALVLGLILVPSMTVGMIDIFDQQTKELKLVSQSLSISTSTFLVRLVFPLKFSAWIRTIALAASRGLGETLAVMMVAGNVIQIPDGMFSGIRTINATIALEMPYAQGIHRASLFAAGLTIFTMVVGLRILVKWASKSNVEVYQ